MAPWNSAATSSLISSLMIGSASSIVVVSPSLARRSFERASRVFLSSASLARRSASSRRRFSSAISSMRDRFRPRASRSAACRLAFSFSGVSLGLTPLSAVASAPFFSGFPGSLAPGAASASGSSVTSSAGAACAAGARLSANVGVSSAAASGPSSVSGVTASGGSWTAAAPVFFRFMVPFSLCPSRRAGPHCHGVGAPSAALPRWGPVAGRGRDLVVRTLAARCRRGRQVRNLVQLGATGLQLTGRVRRVAGAGAERVLLLPGIRLVGRPAGELGLDLLGEVLALEGDRDLRRRRLLRPHLPGDELLDPRDNLLLVRQALDHLDDHVDDERGDRRELLEEIEEDRQCGLAVRRARRDLRHDQVVLEGAEVVQDLVAETWWGHFLALGVD